MCKVYTGYHGTSEICVLCAYTVDNPRATGVQTIYFSLVVEKILQDVKLAVFIIITISIIYLFKFIFFFFYFMSFYFFYLFYFLSFPTINKYKV